LPFLNKSKDTLLNSLKSGLGINVPMEKVGGSIECEKCEQLKENINIV